MNGRDDEGSMTRRRLLAAGAAAAAFPLLLEGAAGALAQAPASPVPPNGGRGAVGEVDIRIDPSDVQVVFADLQDALIARSATVPPEAISTAAEALARVAGILKLPTVFLTVPVAGNPEELIPSLRPFAGRENTFSRRVTGPFLVPEIVAALSANRRRILVVAGFSAETAVLQTSLGAIEAGYDVFVCVDAIGSRSERTEAAAIREMENAGGVTTSVRSVLLRMAPDSSRPPGSEVMQAIGSL